MPKVIIYIIRLFPMDGIIYINIVYIYIFQQ